MTIILNRERDWLYNCSRTINFACVLLGQGGCRIVIGVITNHEQVATSNIISGHFRSGSVHHHKPESVPQRNCKVKGTFKRTVHVQCPQKSHGS